MAFEPRQYISVRVLKVTWKEYLSSQKSLDSMIRLPQNYYFPSLTAQFPKCHFNCSLFHVKVYGCLITPITSLNNKFLMQIGINITLEWCVCAQSCDFLQLHRLQPTRLLCPQERRDYNLQKRSGKSTLNTSVLPVTSHHSPRGCRRQINQYKAPNSFVPSYTQWGFMKSFESDGKKLFV